ncbi:hypothetical protein MICAK_2650005 [Microcystis aeruginosa PCC 9701]|uniref:Uncharacterized protein n=1 Tax=Microcystis aeruginosa PCC 9701 TaxID=721123 RepID=I4IQY1_MICAE|nr:hypothetical protein MICAK_2650005 [Microcystis aeruginosa PCC 9701]
MQVSQQCEYPEYSLHRLISPDPLLYSYLIPLSLQIPTQSQI